MRKIKEVLINPDKVSKISISKEEKILYYRINDSIFSTLPIINWFVPSIKIILKEENKEAVIKSFNEYDSFKLWIRNNEFSLDTVPSVEFFWSQHGDIPLRKKPYIIFYGLDGKDIGKMEFKSKEALDKALEELKRLRFVHFSNSR